MGGSLGALFVAFLAAGFVEIWLEQRLYGAVRARDPERYEAESAWAERVQAHPTSLIRETVSTTRSRLGILVRRSPYPEVERLRRLTLIAVVVTTAIFVLIMVN